MAADLFIDCTGLPSLLLGACTTVQITAGDGVTTIERQFGFANITVAPGATPVVAGMSTLGYSSSPAGVSLGWSGVQFVALPEGCRVVLWIQRPEDLATYQRLTAGAPDVCALNLNLNLKESVK